MPNRGQILIYIGITFLASWIEQYFIINGKGVQDPIRAFALMWTPGLAGVACALIFDRNLKSLAINRASLKSLVTAYVVPAVTSALVVGLLIVFSLAQFQVSPQLIEKKGSLGSALFSALVTAPTVGMILAFVSGLGEEIGWRGFLHSRLLSISTSNRYFVTGMIWSIWHWPLILFGDYATSDHPWINVLFFTTAVTSISFLMGWLRDESNSSIPAALMHASHNMWLLGIAPAFFMPGPFVPYFGGESGLFCALIYMIFAIGIFLKTRKPPITKRSLKAPDSRSSTA